jgi:hypothetical protein
VAKARASVEDANEEIGQQIGSLLQLIFHTVQTCKAGLTSLWIKKADRRNSSKHLVLANVVDFKVFPKISKLMSGFLVFGHCVGTQPVVYCLFSFL